MISYNLPHDCEVSDAQYEATKPSSLYVSQFSSVHSLYQI